jgi:hypothetical protein
MQRSAKPSWVRRTTLVIVLGLVAAAASGGLWWLLTPPPRGGRFAELVSAPTPVSLDAAGVARVEAFCSDCHRLPHPDSFPRSAWHTEVRMGFEFYAKSGRTDLQPPTIAEAYAYYRERAPEQVAFPNPPDAAQKLNVEFRIDKRQYQEPGGVAPAIAQLKWMSLKTGSQPTLVVTDMRSGTIMSLNPTDAVTRPQALARLDNPCHVEPCDLDADGILDLVVADLGSFPPNDHDRGRVVWLRGREGGGDYEPIVIAQGLGRVADVRPGDFDNDGDLDLVVAVFGMDRTGDIRVLWNVAARGQPPEFRSEILDPRPGPIHVPPVDLNGDGYLDFFSLISQNYEQVAVFMNQRGSYQKTAPFHMQTLYEGPDLTFGSSGIELADLDGDGDVDVVYTNGDAFDNGFVNPSHGVQWLENQGQLKFVCHRLTDLTGAYTARVGDLDLDGDQDIIVVVWMPGDVEPKNVFEHPLASIICLEQTAPGQFVRHTLEQQTLIHAALELADFDGDGDLDFVVGSHTLARGSDLPYWIAFWWNQRK